MRKIFPAALFLLPVLFLLPNLAEFPYTAGSVYSDFAISHYPNMLFLQRELSAGNIPLWSPTILSGYPFAANPLAGLFYLPGWLALLFPLPFGINLVIALHLLWGGWGMYRLLRAESLGQPAALFGALTFSALPKLFSHLGAGHITLIYAVSWTPWLLYFERRTTQIGRLPQLVPGVLLGVIALADIRWAAYAGLFWLAYSARGLNIRNGAALASWAFGRLINALVALLAAAALLLPLVEYTMYSTRAALTAEESLILSLPPGQLFGLVYPYIGGMAEWVLYPGAVAAVLALLAICRPAIRRKACFWLWTVLATLVFALGEAVPLLPLILQFPGLSLLRVPPRVLFLTGLAFAAVSGIAVDVLLCNSREGSTIPPVNARGRWMLVMFGAAVFVALLGAAVWLVVPQPLTRIQFAWGAIFFAAGAAVILLAREGGLRTGGFVLLLSLHLIDIIGVNSLSLDFRPQSAIFSPGQEAAEFLRERIGSELYRVYSPSYSVPQHIAAWYRLELADGVDPLQLDAYARFMDSATGVPRDGYGVTIPPFANGMPERDNIAYTPDPARLGLLNVRYLVAEFPLEVEGLRQVAQFGESRVYENSLAMPRVWVQAAGAPLGAEISSVPKLERGTNWITLSATGPGLLVLAEIAFPGWQVTVNGAPAALETPGGLFRGVILPEGEHRVHFSFRPTSVYLGFSIGMLTWLVIIMLVWRDWKRNG